MSRSLTKHIKDGNIKIKIKREGVAKLNTNKFNQDLV